MKPHRSQWLFFILLFPLFTYAQQPAATGSTVGNVYTNDALGLTWQYPKEWVAQKDPGQPKGGRTEVLINVATPAGDSVAVLAEDYRDTPGFGVHYSDSLKEMLEKQGWQSVGERRHRTVGGGVDAVEDRFKTKTPPTSYLALMCGDIRGYELKFMIESDSLDRIDQIEKAIGDVKVRPDWSTGEKVEGPTDSSSAQTARLSEAVSHGLLTKSVQPEYPEEARSKKIKGSVVMLAHINTVGHVQDLYVVEGNPLLIPAALKAVSQWEYKPYLLDGKPANVETEVVVSFSLK